MPEPAKLSFELNEEMLDLIGQELNIRDLVGRFAQAIAGKKKREIEAIAEEIFTRYGIDWIRKSLQLGEEYPDRTYEVLREAIDSTGGHLWFPLLPQRFLEIAYLATFKMELLPVYENTPQRLDYRVFDCEMFQALKDECGAQTAKTLPCRHACLSACRTLFDDLDYPDVRIAMGARTDKEGYCQFLVTKQ